MELVVDCGLLERLLLLAPGAISPDQANADPFANASNTSVKSHIQGIIPSKKP